MRKAQLEGVPAECTLIVATGDGLAADLETALWAKGLIPLSETPEVPFDVILISARDLQIFQAHHTLTDLAASGLPLIGGASVDWPSIAPLQVTSCNRTRIAFLGLTSLGEHSDPLTTVKKHVSKARHQSDIIILLSNLGLPEERRIAREVKDIDIILDSGRALDQPEKVQDTLLVPQKFPGRSVTMLRLVFNRDGELKQYQIKNLFFFPPS
ncbi:MAG: hypothetical protein J7M05_07620 [Anaerolineae bacterium]|nr:hypothetical protein [Anaerolineae bacterium]